MNKLNSEPNEMLTEEAKKFIADNLDRFVTLLTHDIDANAETRLHDLRIDFYTIHPID
jgi:hypothetical protein